MRGGLSIANALNRSIKVYVWEISLATYNLAVWKISSFQLYHHRITLNTKYDKWFDRATYFDLKC